MQKINWGIIGCGDVTEIKSGPAFNKVKNSALVAVMRRDAEKAKDYAKRHNVPTWYDKASDLINDPKINAIYIATPPSSHEEYTIAATQAGKPVYVEKPMTLNFDSATRMMNIANQNNVKLVVAHYRRAQPFFKKIKELINEKAVGDIRFAKIELYKKPASQEYLTDPKTLWRVNPSIAGGGLFNDLAPHQLDLAYYFFGEIEKASGYATNQAGMYQADDIVAGNILFKSGVLLSGTWCFNVAEQDEKDSFEITGSEGKISFSIFGNHEATVTKNGKTEIISFEIPAHVQQPMIEKVVEYFLEDGPNPCSAKDGVEIMRLIDKFTLK
ncbi:MAG: Gfo/Idh/MocA family oxidoreductase [Ginsengibacter sp.]